MTFAENANKKEATFWNEFRPVPLTEEESTNYLKKDSIQTIRKSQVYLDSIDAKGNKFNFLKIILGKRKNAVSNPVSLINSRTLISPAAAGAAAGRGVFGWPAGLPLLPVVAAA